MNAFWKELYENRCQNIKEAKDQKSTLKSFRKAGSKYARNISCKCGSGRKFKNCCENES